MEIYFDTSPPFRYQVIMIKKNEETDVENVPDSKK